VKSSLLSESIKIQFEDYVEQCSDLGADAKLIRRVVNVTLKA
jgi:hypothetical protein